jgi:hypothetical protein
LERPPERESIAQQIVLLARKRDPRLGIDPERITRSIKSSPKRRHQEFT